MSECLHASDLFVRGALLPRGYWAWTRRRTVYGHRHVWEESFGPIPDGQEVHHVCGVRDCVNPEHLTLVGRLDHIQLHRSATCKRGLHAMEGDNVTRDPFPRCRACRNAARRKKTHGAPSIGKQLAAGPA